MGGYKPFLSSRALEKMSSSNGFDFKRQFAFNCILPDQCQVDLVFFLAISLKKILCDAFFEKIYNSVKNM